jgi:hypothetical protein
MTRARLLIVAWALGVAGFACLAVSHVDRAEAYWQSRDSNYNIAVSGAAPSGISYVAASATDLGNNGQSCTGGAAPFTCYTISYTGASGLTHGMLVVAFLADVNNNDCFTPNGGVTYNGVTMTLAQNYAPSQHGADRYMNIFYLLNPPSGAHNLVFSCGHSNEYILAVAAEYQGVQQTGQPDALATADSGASTVTSLTTTIPIANSNSWAIIFNQDSANTMSAGAGVTQRATCAAFNDCFLGDSNGGLATGNNNMTVNTSGAARIQSNAVSFIPG